MTCICGKWQWASMKPGSIRCGRWSITRASGACGQERGGVADGGNAAAAYQDGAVLVIGVAGGVGDAVGLAQEAQDAATQDLVGHFLPLCAHGRTRATAVKPLGWLYFCSGVKRRRRPEKRSSGQR